MNQSAREFYEWYCDSASECAGKAYKFSNGWRNMTCFALFMASAFGVVASFLPFGFNLLFVFWSFVWLQQAREVYRESKESFKVWMEMRQERLEKADAIRKQYDL